MSAADQLYSQLMGLDVQQQPAYQPAPERQAQQQAYVPAAPVAYPEFPNYTPAPQAYVPPQAVTPAVTPATTTPTETAAQPAQPDWTQQAMDAASKFLGGIGNAIGQSAPWQWGKQQPVLGGLESAAEYAAPRVGMAAGMGAVLGGPAGVVPAAAFGLAASTPPGEWALNQYQEKVGEPFTKPMAGYLISAAHEQPASIWTRMQSGEITPEEARAQVAAQQTPRGTLEQIAAQANPFEPIIKPIIETAASALFQGKNPIDAVQQEGLRRLAQGNAGEQVIAEFAADPMTWAGGLGLHANIAGGREAIAAAEATKPLATALRAEELTPKFQLAGHWFDWFTPDTKAAEVAGTGISELATRMNQATDLAGLRSTVDSFATAANDLAKFTKVGGQGTLYEQRAATLLAGSEKVTGALHEAVAIADQIANKGIVDEATIAKAAKVDRTLIEAAQAVRDGTPINGKLLTPQDVFEASKITYGTALREYAAEQAVKLFNLKPPTGPVSFFSNVIKPFEALVYIGLNLGPHLPNFINNRAMSLRYGANPLANWARELELLKAQGRLPQALELQNQMTYYQIVNDARNAVRQAAKFPTVSGKGAQGVGGTGLTGKVSQLLGKINQKTMLRLYRLEEESSRTRSYLTGYYKYRQNLDTANLLPGLKDLGVQLERAGMAPDKRLEFDALLGDVARNGYVSADGKVFTPGSTDGMTRAVEDWLAGNGVKPLNWQEIARAQGMDARAFRENLGPEGEQRFSQMNGAIVRRVRAGEDAQTVIADEIAKAEQDIVAGWQRKQANYTTQAEAPTAVAQPAASELAGKTTQELAARLAEIEAKAAKIRDPKKLQPLQDEMQAIADELNARQGAQTPTQPTPVTEPVKPVETPAQPTPAFSVADIRAKAATITTPTADLPLVREWNALLHEGESEAAQRATQAAINKMTPERLQAELPSIIQKARAKGQTWPDQLAQMYEDRAHYVIDQIRNGNPKYATPYYQDRLANGDALTRLLRGGNNGFDWAKLEQPYEYRPYESFSQYRQRIGGAGVGEAGAGARPEPIPATGVEPGAAGGAKPVAASLSPVLDSINAHLPQEAREFVSSVGYEFVPEQGINLPGGTLSKPIIKLSQPDVSLPSAMTEDIARIARHEMGHVLARRAERMGVSVPKDEEALADRIGSFLAGESVDAETRSIAETGLSWKSGAEQAAPPVAPTVSAAEPVKPVETPAPTPAFSVADIQAKAATITTPTADLPLVREWNALLHEGESEAAQRATQAAINKMTPERLQAELPNIIQKARAKGQTWPDQMAQMFEDRAHYILDQVRNGNPKYATQYFRDRLANGDALTRLLRGGDNGFDWAKLEQPYEYRPYESFSQYRQRFGGAGVGAEGAGARPEPVPAVGAEAGAAGGAKPVAAEAAWLSNPVSVKQRIIDLEGSIREGEMRLQVGKDVFGKRMNADARASIQRAIDYARAEIEQLKARLPLPEQPAVAPTVTAAEPVAQQAAGTAAKGLTRDEVGSILERAKVSVGKPQKAGLSGKVVSVEFTDTGTGDLIARQEVKTVSQGKNLNLSQQEIIQQAKDAIYAKYPSHLPPESFGGAIKAAGTVGKATLVQGKDIQAGDTVMYSKNFISSIGAKTQKVAAGEKPIAQLSGKILEVKQVGKNLVAKVEWEDGKLSSALYKNLENISARDRVPTLPAGVGKAEQDAAKIRLVERMAGLPPESFGGATKAAKRGGQTASEGNLYAAGKSILSEGMSVANWWKKPYDIGELRKAFGDKALARGVAEALQKGETVPSDVLDLFPSLRQLPPESFSRNFAAGEPNPLQEPMDAWRARINAASDRATTLDEAATAEQAKFLLESLDQMRQYYTGKDFKGFVASNAAANLIRGHVNGNVLPALLDAEKAAQLHGQWLQNQIMLNMDARYKYLDDLGILMMPFPMWRSRFAKTMVENALDNPALLSFYLHASKELSKLQNDPSFPTRLRGLVGPISLPFAPNWMGPMYANPIETFFPIQQTFGMTRYSNGVQDSDVAQAIRALQLRGEITAEDSQKAINEQSGPIWDAAKQKLIAATQMTGGLTDLFKTHLPFQIIQDWIAGKPIDWTGYLPPLGMLNMGAQIAGVQPPLPVSQVEQGRIDKQLAIMVAQGEITQQQMDVAKLSRSGKDYMEAARRAGITDLMRYGTAYQQFLPQGEKTYYDARLRRDQLLDQEVQRLGGNPAQMNSTQKWDYLSTHGGSDAMTKFYADNPSLGGFADYNKEPEALFRDYLVGQIWDAYRAAPELKQKIGNAELGDLWKQYFLDKTQRDYDQIPLGELEGWAKYWGVGVPKTPAFEQPQPEPYRPALTSKDQEARYQAFYDKFEQGVGWNRYYAGWDAYYAIPETDKAGRKAYLDANKWLTAASDAQKQFFKDNPDIETLLVQSGAKKPQVATDPTQGQAFYAAVTAAGMNYDQIQQWEKEFYALPEKSQQRRDYLATHPGLIRYWNFSDAFWGKPQTGYGAGTGGFDAYIPYSYFEKRYPHAYLTHQGGYAKPKKQTKSVTSHHYYRYSMFAKIRRARATAKIPPRITPTIA